MQADELSPPPPSKRQKISFDPPAKPEPILFQPSLPISTKSTTTSDSPPKLTPSNPREKNLPIHGNYKAYYSKRKSNPSALDPRLALIPKEWIKGKKVLDVGCNAGVVTVEVARRLEAGSVVGVDIDESLIRFAQKHVDLVWSRQQPSKRLLDAARILSRPTSSLPVASTSSPAPTPTPTTSSPYFPISLPRMFGHLPIPPRALLTTFESLPEIETTGSSGRKGKRKVMPLEIRSFPENVRFRKADWVEEKLESDRKGYDVILAFSITKWIHLNSLNSGLFHFFSRCYKSLLPGGRLILEPQSFSSYAKSAKFSEELKTNYEKLKEEGWKAEEGDFEKVLLEEVGFERVEKLGETGRDGFRRPVEVYYKRAGSYL